MHFAHRCPIGYDFASQNPDGGAAVNVIGLMLGFLRAVLLARAALVAENLALRRQLAVFQVSMKRAKLRKCDRLFWVWLSRLWSGWRSCLMIVKPETVIRWHRAGFWLHWRWKSRKKRARPRTEAEIRALIRRMARENPLWGAPRIQSELALLDCNGAESTVARYMDPSVGQRSIRPGPYLAPNRAGGILPYGQGASRRPALGTLARRRPES